MASPNEPNPNLPVDEEIDYDARGSQPLTQPAAPNEQDTPMLETAYPPLPPSPPSQPSNSSQIGHDMLDQASAEVLENMARNLGLPLSALQQAMRPPAFPQPVVSQPVVSQPVVSQPVVSRPVFSRQQPQVQPAQTQHMPTPGTAGPPNSIYTCPNCQRKGHPLRECPGPPDRFGYIPGCPKCQKWDHTLAQCPKGFTIQDVFHFIFFSRRNNFPMIWDTDLLDPEMATFLSEAQPWTQGFARQQMAQHPARDWDWHPEGTVPDPAWHLNQPLPAQIHPQAPAKVTSFTPAEMQQWKERRLENARRKGEADRVSRPSGQHAGGRSSSDFRGPARNQPGGKRARGQDPLRRVDNSSRSRVSKPGKPSKPRATGNAESKLLDILGNTIKLIATTNVGGSQDQTEWGTERAHLGNQSRGFSRSSSREGVWGGSPGYRAASPQRSMLDGPRSNRRAASPTRSQFDNTRGRRARSPTGSRYDDPRPARRSASPADTRFDDPRGGPIAASPQRSILDSHRGNHRAASPQHSRFDNRDNRGNRRAPSSQDFRHDDLRDRGSGSHDNTRSQSNRRRSSPHGRILDGRANRAASPQASRLDLRGNNRAPSPQNSRYGSPRGGGRSLDVTRSDSHRRRLSPHSAVLDDSRRTESEDCQDCKQPGHHHTRCPQNPRTSAPTRAVAQIEQSFDTRVNHLLVPANRRTRPEGVCFNCMIQNHEWRGCPFPCMICGQDGHGQQHCTKED